MRKSTLGPLDVQLELVLDALLDLREAVGLGGEVDLDDAVPGEADLERTLGVHQGLGLAAVLRGVGEGMMHLSRTKGRRIHLGRDGSATLQGMANPI